MRQNHISFESSGYGISIHASLTGCDHDIVVCTGAYSFISIHASLTGCDVGVDDLKELVFNISIHASLTGCDLLMQI